MQTRELEYNNNSKNNVDISIILLTKNGRRYIDEVLSMIFKQKTNHCYEVIAIDSGSVDGTLEILRRYPIRLIRIKPEEFNHGATRNLGAKLSRGRYLVYIVQDATPANEYWLENLVKNLENDKKVAGACSRVLPRSSANPLIKRDTLTELSGRNYKAISFISVKQEHKKLSYKEKRSLVNFHNVSSCIRRDILNKIPFSPIFFGEDLEWGKRVIEAGYKIVHEPSSIVYHSHEYSLVTVFKRNFDDAKANRIIFNQKVSIKSVPPSILRQTIRDFKYIIKENSIKLGERIKWILYSPFYRFMQAIGQYIGANFEKIPKKLSNYLSITEDKRKGRIPG